MREVRMKKEIFSQTELEITWSMGALVGKHLVGFVIT
jgi:hypothetical protein